MTREGKALIVRAWGDVSLWVLCVLSYKKELHSFPL